jgi:acyl-[acyl-carrier-protein]-phospholipid O-acyltransferase / long-chain-fatty-acid--[acyl-carrier-protein] ligase
MNNEYSFSARIFSLGFCRFLSFFCDFAVISYAFLYLFLRDVLLYEWVLFSFLCYMIPAVIVADVAKMLIRRISSRNALVVSCLLTLPVYLLFAVLLHSQIPILLLFAVVLLGTTRGLAAPAVQELMHEHFPSDHFAQASGICSAMSTIGMFSGAIVGLFVFGHVVKDILPATILLLMLSLIKLFFAMRILPVPFPEYKSKMSLNWFANRLTGYKKLLEERPFLTMVQADAWFVGATSGMLIWGLGGLGTKNFTGGAFALVIAISFGVVTGFITGAVISKRRSEIGFVVPAAFGVIVLSLLLGFMDDEVVVVEGFHLLPWKTLFMFLFGLCSGVALTTLRAWQLQFSNRHNRARLFTETVFNAYITVIVTILICLFLITRGCHQAPLFIAVTTAVLSLLAFWSAPQFIFRFITLVFSHSLYKVKIRGEENIPDNGPAILVANHVSFVDHLLITTCTSRYVHFMMHKSFYRYPVLYPIVKWAEFIEVPDKGSRELRAFFEEVRDVLREGHIVCVFPEGGITRNGIMRNFRHGLKSMVPPGIDVPVIPVRLGMVWGSIFSYYFGKIKLRIPNQVPHPATVTIGEPMCYKTSSYMMRLRLSELAAETELLPGINERPLHYQFARMAKRRPFYKRMKDFDGTKTKEYRNFSALVGAIVFSRYIRSLGDCENVGVLMPNTGVTMIILNAILMADKTPAILNYTASSHAMDTAIEKAELTHIITSRIFLKKLGHEPLPQMVFLEDIAKEIPRSHKILAATAVILLPISELMNIVSPRSCRDIYRTASILFTSGSSGVPKGVMLSHHNITSDLTAMIRLICYTSKDKMLGSLPLFHSFGLTCCGWLPLAYNSDVVFTPNPLDGKAVCAAIREFKLTVMLATPSFLQTYMRRGKPEDFASLRLAVSGAEKLRQDIYDKFKEMTGLTIAEGYGATELSPVVSINVASSVLDLGTSIGCRDSIGPPLPGICVKIVDPDTWEIMPENTDGLLLVKGPNVMKGYLKEPEKTAEVIKDGWYITGDVGRMNADGYITLTGRLSRFSKIAGEMVPHELVEKELMEILQHEERCVAVCGAEDDRKGEKLLVFHSIKYLDVKQIIENMREHNLPNLWIPKADNFVQIESLPLLGTGKLDLPEMQKIVDKYVSTGESIMTDAPEKKDMNAEKTMLEYVRNVIQAKLDKTPLPSPPDLADLKELGACFVTLHTASGQLRGCIGTIIPHTTLGADMQTNAIKAAFSDPRFSPLTATELADVELEISILTPMEDIASPDDFIVGEHGILLRLYGRSAVFLPQVAPEQGWDRDTTLAHLSMKAGLKPGAWKVSDARFQVFRAIHFSESEIK